MKLNRLLQLQMSDVLVCAVVKVFRNIATLLGFNFFSKHASQ